MAGYEIVLVPPTTLDFTGLQAVANIAQIVPLARRVDISRFEFAQINIRLHSYTIDPDNESVLI